MIRYLKSNNFAILIAILSVIVQSFHSFSVFYRLSSIRDTAWGVAQAVLFSVIIDLAILFYTVRKNIKVTWMAGFVMVLINCYYYYTNLGLGFDLIMGGLLSLVIPVSVYYYSEEIQDDAHLVHIGMDIANGKDHTVNSVVTVSEVEYEDRPSDKSLLNVTKPMPHTDRPVRE